MIAVVVFFVGWAVLSLAVAVLVGIAIRRRSPFADKSRFAGSSAFGRNSPFAV